MALGDELIQCEEPLLSAGDALSLQRYAEFLRHHSLRATVITRSTYACKSGTLSRDRLSRPGSGPPPSIFRALSVRGQPMATAKQKHAAVVATFGNIPLDSENLDWLYSRRHLPTVRDGKWRDLRYVVECDELERGVRTALDRIRTRDGARVRREVADRLADSITQEGK